MKPVDVDPAEVLPCGFTPVPGTPLRAYNCNPVFTGTEEPWATDLGAVAIRAQPLLGHPVYQIWYTTTRSSEEGRWALGHAISTNGVDWQVHPDNPVLESTGGWDADGMEQLGVVWDSRRSHYTLAYQGYNLDPVDPTFGLGVLTSTNGVAFRYPDDREPTLDLSVIQSGRDYCWPLSLQYIEDGYTGLLAGGEAGGQRCGIYAFETANVTQPFALDARPILAAGPESYDQTGMVSASYVAGTDREPSLLFYVGFESWRPIRDNLVTPQGLSLAVATTVDGGTRWSKLPTNPLPIATEGTGPTHVYAQRVGERIFLWVTADHPELQQQAVDFYVWDTTPQGQD